MTNKRFSYLYKFMGQFEGRVLKAEVFAWRTGENETKVDVDDVTFRVEQNVAVVSESKQQH